MDFNDYEHEQQFLRIWQAVTIARPVRHSLFTFGESVLPYFLVCGDDEPGSLVAITKGEVHIKRALVITPETARGDLRNFFESADEEDVAQFLLARTAHFSNLQLDNRRDETEIVSDSIEEAVARLNRQLDSEEEDRVAILTAPRELGGVALLRYAAERVLESAPDNIQELRERGFLP